MAACSTGTPQCLLLAPAVYALQSSFGRVLAALCGSLAGHVSGNEITPQRSFLPQVTTSKPGCVTAPAREMPNRSLCYENNMF